jgi:hypothetical protein
MIPQSPETLNRDHTDSDEDEIGDPKFEDSLDSNGLESTGLNGNNRQPPGINAAPVGVHFRLP